MQGRSNLSPKYAGATLAECQRLWNEFDPIGLYVGWNEKWSKREYDRYAQHSLKLLISKAGHPVISNYVRSVVEISLGLNGFPGDEMEAFAKRLESLSQRRD